MKILLPTILCGLLFGTSASFRAQDGSADAALEAQVAELRAKNQELEAAMEEVQAYLKAQAASASRVLAAVQASEEAGFAKGINWQSREILLNAWRDYHGTLQKAVPGSKKTDETARRVR